MDEKKETQSGNTESRRDFMFTVVRGAILAGVGVLGFLLLRKSAFRPSGPACVGQGVCRSCVRRGDCALREAQSERDLRRTKGGAP